MESRRLEHWLEYLRNYVVYLALTSPSSPYLWSYIVRCAAKCFGGQIPRNAFFTHAEVRYLDVSVLVEEDVVELQVPVDDVTGVQVEQAYGDLGGVEPGGWGGG